MKFHIKQNQINNRIAKIITMNRENMEIEYRYNTNILETRKCNKIKDYIFSNEVAKILGVREIKLKTIKT